MRWLRRSSAARALICATSGFVIAACGSASGDGLFGNPTTEGGAGSLDSEPEVGAGGTLGDDDPETSESGASSEAGAGVTQGSGGQAGGANDAGAAGASDESSEDGSGGASGAPREGASSGAGGTENGEPLRTDGTGGAHGGTEGGGGSDGGDEPDAGAGGLGPGESACDDLVIRCRPFDLGVGVTHECDELGRGRNEAACLAERAACVRACSSGELLPFQIEFAPRIGERPYDCAATYTGVGADAAAIRPVDFRIYVHDVKLVDESGEVVPAVLDADDLWQTEDVVLLDFENRAGRCSAGTVETNTRIVGTVPWGQYRGLEFKLGLPVELNHAELADLPPPLNVASMFLSRRTGREFLSLANSADLGGGKTFESVLQVHSTGCDEYTEGVVTCSKPNRAEYRFARFWSESSRVVANVGELLTKSELKSERCQSSEATACAWPFDILGIDWITGKPESSIQRFIQIE